ncbi:hypothetical protein RDI58_027163 [Solanum bulbocastanum]|uniref:Uncharacterized protein n=1 Tax=Solanum bulbocastanum TaxID=147425 RepID=A0AAN8T086_SOLBU
MVDLDEDKNPLVRLGTHADSSSSGSDLLPGARDTVVDTSIVDELNLDHARNADVDDDQHTLEVVPELPFAAPTPRRSTRATALPTWHQDNHIGPKVAKLVSHPMGSYVSYQHIYLNRFILGVL